MGFGSFMSNAFSGLGTGILGAAASIGGSYIQKQAQKQTNQMNMKMFNKQQAFEKEQYAYMQSQNDLNRQREDEMNALNRQREDQYNQTMWNREDAFNQTTWNREDENNRIMREREDNVLQRRMADAKAAGIHPVIAAGGQAQAGAGQVGGGSVGGGSMTPGRVGGFNSGAKYGADRPNVQGAKMDPFAALSAGLQTKLMAAQIGEIESKAKLNNAEAGDVSHRATDRRSSVQNLEKYHSALIEGAKDQRTIQKAFNESMVTLKSRELDQADKKIALDTLRQAVESSLANKQKELMTRQINRSLADQIMNREDRKLARDKFDELVRQYETTLDEGKRRFLIDKIVQVFSTVVNAGSRVASAALSL